MNRNKKIAFVSSVLLINVLIVGSNIADVRAVAEADFGDIYIEEYDAESNTALEQNLTGEEGDQSDIILQEEETEPFEFDESTDISIESVDIAQDFSDNTHEEGFISDEMVISDEYEFTETRQTEEMEEVKRIQGYCGDNKENILWSLDGNGVLSINGQGKMANWEHEQDVPWYEFSDIITGIMIGDGVASVGSYAFCNCQFVTEIVIPDSVEEIGAFAFFNCNGLSAVSIG